MRGMMRNYATALALTGALACATQAKMPQVQRPAITYAPQPTLIEDVEKRMKDLEKPVLDKAKAVELKNEFFDLLKYTDLAHSLQTDYGTLSSSFDDTLNLSDRSENYIADFDPDQSYLVISVEKIIRNKDGTVRGVQDVIYTDGQIIECRTYTPSVKRTRATKIEASNNTSLFPFELEPVDLSDDVISLPPADEGPICTEKFLFTVDRFVAALKEARETR